MSNTIRYDALLTRHLARELDAALRSRRVSSVHFDRERQQAQIAFEHGALTWSTVRGPQLVPSMPATGDLLSIPRKATIDRFEGLPDERILRLDFGGGSRTDGVRSIVFELLPPEHDLVALDDAGRVVKSLIRAASRLQTRGQPYKPPPARERIGATARITLAEWVELLGSVAPGERLALLIRRVAWVSPINAAAILGAAASNAAPAELTNSYDRYGELIDSPTRPCLLRSASTLQPYLHSLWQTDALPQPTLLEAIERAGSPSAAEASPIERLENALQRERRKRARLLQESESAADEAVQLRAAADLVLARSSTIKRGAKRVELIGFNGETRLLELDPALSVAANAEAWYEEARRRERAAERVPVLLADTDRVIAGIEARLERARAGEVIELPQPKPTAGKQQPTSKLPYRRYRTSGGLEVRVGRSSRDNDELTFKHSAPNDIWMHARAVGGAHVVLRWTDAGSNPPAADLRDAAIIAAVHSKARHAGTVPIDWTRRKYVRKGRHSPPGQVLVERVKTLFVAPDDALEKTLKWPEERV